MYFLIHEDKLCFYFQRRLCIVFMELQSFIIIEFHVPACFSHKIWICLWAIAVVPLAGFNSNLVVGILQLSTKEKMCAPHSLLFSPSFHSTLSTTKSKILFLLPSFFHHRHHHGNLALSCISQSLRTASYSTMSSLTAATLRMIYYLQQMKLLRLFYQSVFSISQFLAARYQVLYRCVKRKSPLPQGVQ